MGAKSNSVKQASQLQGPPRPVPVSDLDIAFPAHALKLMPTYAEIPNQFKEWNIGNAWIKVAMAAFYEGGELKWKTKQGIEHSTAIRQIKCILGSFEPKHEHKIAAVAYLLSCWYESFQVGDKHAP